MSVGLFIITHGDIGRSLLDTAVVVMECCPLQVETMGIPMASDPDQQLERARQYLQQLETGDGVLILTDLYGSTPSNIACKLCNNKVNVVTGLNLPMLIRVLNYPNLNLHELAQKAVGGGREGVVAYMPGATP
ncbi:MAG: PTS sugar transporter subunit IIA [Thiohalomonadales bacterium]|nr:PTS sugar transporter subunit IIA [Thiohalomonadales bacterium]